MQLTYLQDFPGRRHKRNMAQLKGGSRVYGDLTVDGSITLNNLSIPGISTLGNVKIYSGIVTSSNPGVTTVFYYGDGSKLQNVGATISAQSSIPGPAYPVLVNKPGDSAVGISSTGTNSFVFLPTSGNLGIGTTNPTSKLSVNGDINIGTTINSSTTITSVSSTSATAIDSFAVATYRSSKIQIQITQGSNYQVSDILVIHDGTNAYFIEYGSIATNTYLGNFSVTVSAGNVLTQIAMNSAVSSTIKVLSQKITV